MSVTTTAGGGLPNQAAPRSTRPRFNTASLGLIPFWTVYAFFFVLPVGALLFLAVRSTPVAAKAAVPAQTCGGLLGCTPTPGTPAVPGVSASFTWKYLDQALHGAFLNGLQNSLMISITTALVAAVLGTVLAYVVVSMNNGFKQLVMSASAVLANFGGIPLAFLFVATLGSAGILTKLSDRAGVDLSDHFNLYGMQGIELVYLYFLIPLMVLVIAPALEGLRPQWREAAQNLGATNWHYWRHVAGPVLVPNLVGSVALLFSSSFAAFATAQALTNGTMNLTPLQINAELNGNVISGPEAQHVAAALALMMVIIVIPLTLLYQLMERRTARWLQS